MTHFTDLGLAQPLLHALAKEGYERPTPIQTKAIPPVMAGRDLLGIAQTGTGKTAAFALPILHRLAQNPKRPAPRTTRVLVLSPTRELASQIAESFETYGRGLKLTVAVIFGGVKHGAQKKALLGGLDVLVATPGRLLDHIAERNVDLAFTEVFVLDEADQMFDMGFIRPVRQIASRLPKQRQSLFFSATMPSDIAALAGELLTDPMRVEVTPQATTVERIRQSVLFVEQSRKRALLAELFSDDSWKRVLVFARTKHGANRVADFLEAGAIPAAAIHGNKSQGQRERALAAFKAGEIRALVATDIAARGIDVDGVTHVVNVDLPNVPEAYVHRIGRTARAGASGIAVSFCSDDERNLLRDIERVTRQKVPTEDRRRDAKLGALEAAIASVEPKRAAEADEHPARMGRGGPQRSSNGRPGGQRQGQGQGQQRNRDERGFEPRSQDQRGQDQRAQGPRGENRQGETRKADFRNGDFRQTDARAGEHRTSHARPNGPKRPQGSGPAGHGGKPDARAGQTRRPGGPNGPARGNRNRSAGDR
jgi:ATP-dependent RNA helicase RhlE